MKIIVIAEPIFGSPHNSQSPDSRSAEVFFRCASIRRPPQLYTPAKAAIRQRQDTAFLPCFWSPVYFTNQAGTMGLLIDNKRPALADFPTADHTDLQ